MGMVLKITLGVALGIVLGVSLLILLAPTFSIELDELFKPKQSIAVSNNPASVAQVIPTPAPIVPTPQTIPPVTQTNPQPQNTTIPSPKPTYTPTPQKSLITARCISSCGRPVYPAIARQQRLEGSVTIKIRINSNGDINKVDIVKSSGYEILDTAAMDKAKNMKFNAIDTNIIRTATQTVSFKLEN